MSSQLLLLLHPSIFLGQIEGGIVLKSNGEINRLGRKFQSGQASTWEDLEILWTGSDLLHPSCRPSIRICILLKSSVFYFYLEI